MGLVEMEDYEEFENINKLKKEITEHFDKFFKEPEFDRLISNAHDWNWFFLREFLFSMTNYLGFSYLNFLILINSE